jgi:hypothetical protein
VNGLFEALRFSDSTVPTYGTRVSEGSAMLKLHGTFNRLVGYDFGDAKIRGHFTIEIRGHFTIEK